MSLYGHTRTVVSSRHALIAPDGHVPSAFPGWSGATAFVIISPAMGADFSQMLVTFPAGPGVAVFPASEHEHVAYVTEGECGIEIGKQPYPLATGGYVFVPPMTAFEINGTENTRVTVFRKIFEGLAGGEPPPLVHGSAADVPGEPFLGNPRALLQTLLPVDNRYDMAVNVFTYQPGATLPS